MEKRIWRITYKFPRLCIEIKKYICECCMFSLLPSHTLDVILCVCIYMRAYIYSVRPLCTFPRYLCWLTVCCSCDKNVTVLFTKKPQNNANWSQGCCPVICKKGASRWIPSNRWQYKECSPSLDLYTFTTGEKKRLCQQWPLIHNKCRLCPTFHGDST